MPDHSTPASEQSSAPRILPLAQATAGGGKARGLAQLISLGLRVPPGFVLAGARPGQLPAELGEAYRRLGGGAVAVRSSAEAEDGRQTSFAGQFETVLDVEGEPALQEAVERCLASLGAARARAYAGDQGEPGQMNVVVQRMVQPRVAGVLFTVDPVSGRRDRVVVDAVPGLGEALVSGRESSDHYELSREGKVLGRELRGAQALLQEAELQRLLSEALQAEAALGLPLDLEWAFDADGALHWLQARPVTGLAIEAAGEELDLHELDTCFLPDHVYTRANIGEMLPGPCGPLTISTTVHGIEQGVQYLQVACGVQPQRTDQLQLVAVYCGHLFFDLTRMAEFARKVGGSTPEQMTFAICGRTVPELKVGPPAHPLLRAVNGVRYLSFVLSGARQVDRYQRRLQAFQLARQLTAVEAFAQIDGKLPFLIEGYDMHMQSSASSGLSHGVLQGVLGKGGPPAISEEARLAGWLEAAGELESAALVEQLELLASTLAAQPGIEAALLGGTPQEALAWLRSSRAGAAGAAFARFLEQQGHRGVRELSMEQPAWGEDPLPLVQSLRASLSAPPGAGSSPPRSWSRPPLRLRPLVAWARRSVRQRERSKALLVQVTDQFRRAYRQLGELLAGEGLLAEAELVQFLTHQELGQLCRSRDPSLSQRARTRRRVQERQQRLEFPDLFIGEPRPLPALVGTGADQLQGRPVSRGRVRGPARVARTLEEAAALRPGEILVAPITDVGWSPYFKLIGGLATDVGSAISHGAVVARECGVPAVVNLRIASKTFRTGEVLILDGDLGTLSRAPRG